MRATPLTVLVMTLAAFGSAGCRRESSGTQAASPGLSGNPDKTPKAKSSTTDKKNGPVPIDTAVQAEKAFRDVEEQLADADAVEINCKVHLKTSSKGKTISDTDLYAATILMAKGNKSNIFVSLYDGRVVTISDGEKTWTVRNKAGKGWIGNTPKNDNAVLAGTIVRGGFYCWLPMSTVDDKPRRNPADLADLNVSDFSWGKKEKIGERQAQIVTYKLITNFADFTGKKVKDTFDAHVWLDIETRLPLKRVLTVQDGDETAQLTETYDIRIGAKIDAKSFELPKK